MADGYCPTCGTRIDAVIDTCPSCRRYLPGTEAYRRVTSSKRKTAAWAIVLGLVILTYGFLSEGGPRVINTRRGMSTAGSIRLQIIGAGLALTGYGGFALYRSREDG
jgi:hypothetical protein